MSVLYLRLLKCGLHKATPKRTLLSGDLARAPFQHMAIDTAGPFERVEYDSTFAISFINYFSKWTEVAFMSNAATAVVMKFLSTLFAHDGNPLASTTD